MYKISKRSAQLATNWFVEQKYLAKGVIVFGQPTGQWAALANVTPGYPLLVGKLTFQTAEGLYHACSFSGNDQVQQLLAHQKTGELAKQIKDEHQRLRRSDWGEFKFLVMEKCLELKVAQHRSVLQPLLRRTHSRHLVEVSAADRRWGTVRQENWLVGCNWMGRIWEKVRAEFLSSETDFLQTDHEAQEFLSIFLRGQK